MNVLKRSNTTVLGLHDAPYKMARAAANAAVKSSAPRHVINVKSSDESGDDSSNDIVKQIVYILIDVSGSMKGERLESAKAAAKKIFALLRADKARGNDSIDVITFNDTLTSVTGERVVSQTTQEKFDRKIDRALAQGRTAIWDAIGYCLESTTSKDEKMIIQCITDGEDVCSRLTKDDVTALLHKHPSCHLNILHIGDNDEGTAQMYQSIGGAQQCSFAASQPEQLVAQSLEMFSQQL